MARYWWDGILTNNAQPRKALASLLHLVGWEIWKEWNARVFREKAVPVLVIVHAIKEETSMWALVGARHLCNLMPRK
ncbi:hypothetical protein CFC21_030656 [Triticum aestivum]|uniref:Uncharacterized protein n=2 Tax=Triticum aestivum TaxID=4565 RepID=A0A9R1EQF3_WHEAT|nr:hypothetical protein CFC21_028397 [Triticum aestivum]KAF7017177.1 hypothetical protein CFC21_030656 [Triticum aestivum]